MKKNISTTNAPAAIGPYSQATEAGGFVFFSGQIAIDPAAGKITAIDVEGQTVQVLNNIDALLAAAGLSRTNVIKTTVYLTNINDFSKVNALYGEFFSSLPPSRSCVGVAALPAGALVEIEVIAAR